MVSLAGLGACAPGSLRWSTGVDDLRTAFFAPSGEGMIDVVASTSAFDCTWPPSDDPVELTERFADLATAACREGARHLVFRLRHAPDTSWEGAYPGVGAVDESPDGSWVMGSYLAIEEARARSSDGLQIHYEATEIAGGPLDTDAEVRVHHLDDDVLRAEFDLGALGARGRLAARPCTGSDSLFPIITEAAALACEL